MWCAALLVVSVLSQDHLLGRPVDDWLRDLARHDREATVQQLAAHPDLTVPVFRAVLRGGGVDASRAAEVLCAIGEDARVALPDLFDAARGDVDGPMTEDERIYVLIAMKRLTWAGKEAAECLEQLVLDESESESIRSWSIGVIREYRLDAQEGLERIVAASDGDLLSHSHWSLATLLENQRRGARSEYFSRLAVLDPLGPETPTHLERATGHYHGRTHEPSVRVKSALWDELEQRPSVEIALRLASIIQHGLSGTNLYYSSPVASGFHVESPRHDIEDNYATLRRVLEQGWDASVPGSEVEQRIGTAVAKLHLLRGDWDAVNRALHRLGQEEIPEGDRPFLAPPPREWIDFPEGWGLAEEAMRNGNGRLIVEVQLLGKGVSGCQVLVRKTTHQQDAVPWAGASLSSAFSDRPLPLDGFGVSGRHRSSLRYAVSGADGKAVLDRLPAGDLGFEVMIPTATLGGTARHYTLWMNLPSVGYTRSRSAWSGGATPGLVSLEPGDTVHYSPLQLVPVYDWSIDRWDAIDPGDLSLHWRDLPQAVEYELELRLCLPPNGSPSPPEAASVLRSWTETTTDTEHRVSKDGVAGQRLAAGNVYQFRVVARDEHGAPVGEFGPTYVWTSWEHRDCRRPHVAGSGYLGLTEPIPESQIPVDSNPWYRSDRQVLRDYLEDQGDAFEREYVEVILAFLDWHQGELERAERSLVQLVDLPEGNYVQLVAEIFLTGLRNGVAPPQSPDLDASFGLLEHRLVPGVTVEGDRYHFEREGWSFRRPEGWHVYPSDREGRPVELTRGDRSIRIQTERAPEGLDIEHWLRQRTAGRSELHGPFEVDVSGETGWYVDEDPEEDGDRERKVFALNGGVLLEFDFRYQDLEDRAALDALLESFDFDG